MKKDDILIMRLVSVAVFLAALALIILLGVRYNIYSKISDNIAAGTVLNSQGRYPLYAEQLYKGLNAIYQILYAMLVYTSIVAVVGIFLRLKGTPSIAKCSGVIGIVTGVYLILTKILEKNELVNGMFSRIYLGQSVHYNSVLDGVSAIPVRAVIFGVLLILLGAVSLVMVKKSRMASLKIYTAGGGYSGLILMMPVIYGTVYVDVVRDNLLDWIFSYTNLSDQIYTILDEYYLLDIFFLSFDKIIVIIVAALAAIALYKTGFKKKLVCHVIAVPTAILSVIGFVIFIMNPKRLYGYVTLDEAICDRIETVGTIAALVMATDMIVIALITALCMEMSGRVSKTRLLTTVGAFTVFSVLAVVVGYLASEITVYVALVVINILEIVALNVCVYNHKR